MTDELPRAAGPAALRGTLRTSPEDFRVTERLNFEPSGAGEHAFLVVEKRGANTEWVARQLARHAGVGPVAIGYAGLKDRHAITRQAYTVHLAGRADPDWSALDAEGVRVVSAVRHARKLQRGALRGNAFEIVVRDVEGDATAADATLAALARDGAPNYFGEQRFGRERGNVDAALAMFAGRRVQREQRSILLSAARSALFNAVLAARVRDGSWREAREGDVFQLDGTGSIFGPEPIDDALLARVASGDVHPTGPLWGRGALRSGGGVAALENGVAQAHEAIARGLEAAGLEQQRRALRVRAAALRHEWRDGALHVAFELPAGAYATTLLAELGDFADATGIRGA
ncbi:MAG TPA: tRNA pseudouridine(13) synthase TruD [Xanthomonadales bacterium]|nr:tRNA pseudouridine(13) synthase TruD [Xanthomonadales bacterium]